MQAQTRKLGIIFTLTAALFGAGLLAGQHGQKIWKIAKQATVDSYLNRYRVMSDSNLSSIVYYVSTKDAASLYAMADSSSEVLDVATTRIKDLYDVRINYSSRVPTVRSLRALKNVDAVITVPLICH